MNATDKTPTYPFTEDEFARANREWGCNCGPSALAFAIQSPLERVRAAIPGFDSKRYTSPTMMKAALANLEVPWFSALHTRAGRTKAINRGDGMSLVRIQWCGPWTAEGANPRWAYRQTHWIAAFWAHGAPCVFDCNGGMRTSDSWRVEIVPLIVSHTPRADGDWFVTHLWSLASST